jgi:hypothetical protein
MKGAGEECVSRLEYNGILHFPWKKIKTLMTVKMSKSHIERPVILVRAAGVWFSEEMWFIPPKSEELASVTVNVVWG